LCSQQTPLTQEKKTSVDPRLGINKEYRAYILMLVAPSVFIICFSNVNQRYRAAIFLQKQRPTFFFLAVSVIGQLPTTGIYLFTLSQREAHHTVSSMELTNR
jgi:hypothetical protein